MSENWAEFPPRVLQVLGLTLGQLPLASVSHDSTLSGAGTPASPLSVIGSSINPYLPLGYNGPTLRNSPGANTPIIVQPTSGSGTSTLTFDTAAQGGQSGDLVVVMIWYNVDPVTSTSFTKIDNAAYSNGKLALWAFIVPAGAYSPPTLTGSGVTLFAAFGCVVIPGTRGTPVLVDGHGLGNGNASNYGVQQNPVAAVAQSPALHLWYGTHFGTGSTTSNQVLLPLPVASGTADGTAQLLFPIFQITGGLYMFGTYRTDTHAQAKPTFPYVGANGGAGNQPTGTVILY